MRCLELLWFGLCSLNNSGSGGWISSRSRHARVGLSGLSPKHKLQHHQQHSISQRQNNGGIGDFVGMGVTEIFVQRERRCEGESVHHVDGSAVLRW